MGFFTPVYAVPAHGWRVSLLFGGGVGGALADPAAVRQQRGLLFHLVQDLLPLHFRLRGGLLNHLLTQFSARHCTQRGEIN